MGTGKWRKDGKQSGYCEGKKNAENSFFSMFLYDLADLGLPTSASPFHQ